MTIKDKDFNNSKKQTTINVTLDSISGNYFSLNKSITVINRGATKNV